VQCGPPVRLPGKDPPVAGLQRRQCVPQFFGGYLMRVNSKTLSILTIGFLAAAAPSLADSVAVTSGSDGTVIVNGKPCRVVTRKDGPNTSSSNSTTITTGQDGVSGSTTISPGGGNSSSVTVGSGSSSTGNRSSSAASSDCVIYRNEK
jgi:hypothetical protein